MTLEEYLRGSVDIGILHHSVSVEVDKDTGDLVLSICANVRPADLLEFTVTGDTLVLNKTVPGEVTVPVGTRS